MGILTLPRELQLHILGHLSVSELMQLSQTCRRLKDLARDPSLWRKLTLTYNMIKNNTVACRDHVSRCSKRGQKIPSEALISCTIIHASILA